MRGNIRFVEVRWRRDLKLNAVKSRVMMLGEEEGLECEVRVDGTRLEKVTGFKYLGCDGAEWEESCRSYHVLG